MARAAVFALLLSACAASSPAPISYGGMQRETGAIARPNSNQPTSQARTHRVAPDESLFDIAEAYQIPLRSLIEQNALEPPYRLTPGRTLELPPPRTHLVARGETFADVAQRYNVDLRSLGLLNRMQPPYAVREGQAIVLPALARPRAVTTPASNPQPQTRTSPPVAANVEARFTWPLRGDVLARFGAQSDGRRLDGVEIAAEEGASVSAAADGDIVYAGDDLAAYGALVLVRHGDGYVTAYGYGRRALVREGERVRAGQAIAEVGRIGERAPRLLFQVRRGTEPVDPLPLMRD